MDTPGTPVKIPRLEEIIINNKRVRDLIQSVEPEYREFFVINTQSVMLEKGLPLERFSDVLYLRRCAPEFVDQLIEAANKVEYKAQKLNLKFEEVVYGALERAGIENLKYSHDCPSYCYLLTAVDALGGMDFQKNRESILREAKADRFSGDSAKNQEIIRLRGLKVLDNLLCPGIGIAEELTAKAMSEPQMPKQDYAKMLGPGKKEYQPLPKKL